MTRNPAHSTRRRGNRARVLVALLGAGLGMSLLASGAAFGYWMSTDSSNAAQALADALPQGATPSAPATTPNPNSNTVSLTFSRVSTTKGNVAIPAADYSLKRYPAAGGSATSVTASCAGSATITCTESSVPDGVWKYTDTPTYATNWVGIESNESAAVTVDTTAPTVPAPGVAATTTYVNGSTKYVNSETLTLTDAATDSGSGVASVHYYYCAGSGTCTSTTGTNIGSSSTGSTYSVTWSSPSPDGPYQIIAVGTDNVGNTATSPAASISVDTTPPTIATPSVNGYS